MEEDKELHLTEFEVSVRIPRGETPTKGLEYSKGCEETKAEGLERAFPLFS